MRSVELCSPPYVRPCKLYMLSALPKLHGLRAHYGGYLVRDNHHILVLIRNEVGEQFGCVDGFGCNAERCDALLSQP